MPSNREAAGAALICALLVLTMPLGSLSAVEAGRITWKELGGITIVVAADGSGDYTHIQWAIDNASVGDTILVRAGEYYETLFIDKSLHIIGDGADRTFIVRDSSRWEPSDICNLQEVGVHGGNAGLNTIWENQTSIKTYHPNLPVLQATYIYLDTHNIA